MSQIIYHQGLYPCSTVMTLSSNLPDNVVLIVILLIVQLIFSHY